MKVYSQKQAVNPTPYAYITSRRNKLKIYNDESVYLKDGQEFEVRLENPTNTRQLAKIWVNDELISQSGIVLNSNETVYLERYLDRPNKFKFTTFFVDEVSETKVARKNNGRVRVEFYSEINYNTITTTLNPNPTWVHEPYILYSGEANTTGTSNFTTVTTSNTNLITDSARSTVTITPTSMHVGQVETGRISDGSKSNQSFVTAHGNFSNTMNIGYEYQILPESLNKDASGFVDVNQCEIDASYFINTCVYIESPTERRRILFKLYPFQETVINTIESTSTIILKARQMGISNLMVAYSLWNAIFKKNHNTVFFATDFGNAKYAASKLKIMLENLPTTIGNKIQYTRSIKGGGTEIITFGNGSSILIATSNSDITKYVHSKTISLVVADEAAFMNSNPIDKNKLHAQIAPESLGGRFVFASTAYNTNHWFYNLYETPRSGLSKLKLSWDCHPHRNYLWFKNEVANLGVDIANMEHNCIFSDDTPTSYVNNTISADEISEIRHYCSKCGYRIRKSSWQYCPKCGNEL